MKSLFLDHLTVFTSLPYTFINMKFIYSLHSITDNILEPFKTVNNEVGVHNTQNMV